MYEGDSQLDVLLYTIALARNADVTEKKSQNVPTLVHEVCFEAMWVQYSFFGHVLTACR